VRDCGLRHWPNRTCPVCAGLPGRGRALLGRLPLMVSCGEHGCRLEDATTVDLEMALPGRLPVAEPLAALDRYTHQALFTGRVGLPGRDVHRCVWYRLLRTLLHEVSLSPSTAGQRDGRTLKLIWETAGHPVRAGLGAWQPYEQLKWPTQGTMLHAAAVTLQLADDGRVTARGVLGAAVRPAPPRWAYAGDPPPPGTAWPDLTAAAEAALDQARTEPDGARQFLGLLAVGSRRREVWEREISFLENNGVPAGFLPDAAELDRLSPTSQPVTAAGRRSLW
jgi:hypothetical protein